MSRLSLPISFDGRNLFEPGRVRRQGFEHTSIGRGTAIPVRAAAGN